MIPRVVLDTHVLVAGLLTPFGTCATILRLLVSERIALAADARILAEYQDVRTRPRFDFEPDKVSLLLDHIRSTAEFHAPRPWPEALPDPDDQPFLEVAQEAGAAGLVTGNLRHYPPHLRFGVQVWSPAEFLEWVRRRAEDPKSEG